MHNYMFVIISDIGDSILMYMVCRVYFDVCRSLIHEEVWWSELTIVVAGYYLKKKTSQSIIGLCLVYWLFTATTTLTQHGGFFKPLVMFSAYFYVSSSLNVCLVFKVKIYTSSLLLCHCSCCEANIWDWWSPLHTFSYTCYVWLHHHNVSTVVNLQLFLLRWW